MPGIFSKVVGWIRPDEETLRRRTERKLQKREEKLEEMMKEYKDRALKRQVAQVSLQLGYSRELENKILKRMRWIRSKPEDVQERIFEQITIYNEGRRRVPMAA